MDAPEQVAAWVGGGVLTTGLGVLVNRWLTKGNKLEDDAKEELKGDVKEILSKVNSILVSVALHDKDLLTLKSALDSLSNRQNEQAKAHKLDQEEMSRRMAILEAKKRR